MPEWFMKRENESDEDWWHRVNFIGAGGDTCECHPDGYRRATRTAHE